MLSKSFVYSCHLGKQKELYPMEFTATHLANRQPGGHGLYQGLIHLSSHFSWGSRAKEFILRESHLFQLQKQTYHTECSF